MTDFSTRFGKYRNVKYGTPSSSTKYVIFKHSPCGGRVLRAQFNTSAERMAWTERVKTTKIFEIDQINFNDC